MGLYFILLCNKVHITQGDHVGKGVIVSWVTMDEPGSSTVLYWSENSIHKNKAKGNFVTYKFYNYTSGYIHHCTIKKLKVNYLSTLFFSHLVSLGDTSLKIVYFLVSVGSLTRNITTKLGSNTRRELSGLRLPPRLARMCHIHLVS